MDTRLIGAGAVVYLPVAHEGALFAAGDLHAAMGDGEICGTGVEVSGAITLRLDVRSDLRIKEPVLETPDLVVTIASAETLDAAAEVATRHMAALLTQRLGLSLEVATMLMSAGGDLQVSQIVDPLRTARFALPKSVIAGLGDELWVWRMTAGRGVPADVARDRGGAMAEGYGAQGMVGRLRRVVMRRPGEAMAAADPAAWHYTSAIDLEEARRAHDAFADALRAWDVEVLYHDEPLPDHSDSVFVFDPVLVTDRGTLRAQHGQGAAARRGGAAGADAAGLRRARSTAVSRARRARRAATRCGSTTTRWRSAAASGRTPRAYVSSAACSGRSASPCSTTTSRTSPAPRRACTCSASISPVDVDLAVAYPPLMPTAFWAELKRRGVRLLEVPEEEFVRTQATNVLTVAPRRCIMLDGSPVTKQLLEMADCEVVTFPGEPLSFKAEGGPTCLTRPVLRDPE